MKHNYFFKWLIIIAFCSVGLTSFAATPIYLAASGGSDSNNGLTAGAPVATLAQAMSLVDVSGTIIVSGIILSTNASEASLIPAGFAIAKHVTIQGTSNVTDGFDGNNQRRFIHIQNATHYNVTLKNLKIFNCYTIGNGGAIYTNTGTLTCENVIFDANKTIMNSTPPATVLDRTGAAIHINNSKGASFKNCVFSNNEASKAGAVYVNEWAVGTSTAPNVMKFEGCAFVGNVAKESFGGSALFIRSGTAYTTLNLINCTIKGNQVLNTATGGAVNLGAKSMQSTKVNIINCTISENTTAGAADKGAGVYFLNSTTQSIGNLYIKNSIIEGNTATGGVYSDLVVYSLSPETEGGGSTTIPGFIKVENSIIGKSGTTTTNIPSGNIISSSYNLQIGSTLVAKLGTYNSTLNYYPLQNSSPAIDKGSSTFLSSLAPSVTTDQLGNTRPFTGGKCHAGSVEVVEAAPTTLTPTISSTTSATTQTNPIPVTITFSEAVTGFDVSDVTVGNGSKSNFVAVNGTTYTVDVTPTVQGIVTINVAADVAVNGSSTPNVAATQLSRTYYKDVYLSETGNDANDGFSPATAVKKFSIALGKAIADQKIYVSGMVDFSTETQSTGVAIYKNITIQGASNTTDGFDGKNLTRFFSNSTYTLTLKNLKLVNGYSGNNNGGAIHNTGLSTIICENVIFEGNKTIMNSVTSGANKRGGAINFDNVTAATFTNCVFKNNEASKTGAIYINNWASTIKFEGCAFIGNIAKESFGGSALFILSGNDNNSLSLLNCTFAKNEVRSAASGGTIYAYKAPANTVVNIINCTVTENTTAGIEATGAGVFMKNTTADNDNYLGKLNIYNTIIEGNRAVNNVYSDFCTSLAPSNTTLQINNSLIGKQGSTVVIPTACFGATNQYNYLTASSTPNDFVAKLAAFNAVSNSYALHVGSSAIGYGNSTYLSTNSTTDQLGNDRTVGLTNYAGAWEATPLATTTPAAPLLVAAAGNAQVALTFSTASTGGSNIVNYKYSTDGGASYTEFSPEKITSPFVFTNLTNGTSYTFKLKAVNANGDGAESAVSNSVTPDALTNIKTISAATNISTIAPTPVSDIVVSSNVLTINQNTTINSLTVAPGAKVTVSGTNTLTATNGITLQSDATGTAINLTALYRNLFVSLWYGKARF